MTSRKVLPEDIHKEILAGSVVVGAGEAKPEDTVLTLPKGATLTIPGEQAGNVPAPDPEPHGETEPETDEEQDEEENPFE
jgi:hypothetical protein